MSSKTLVEDHFDTQVCEIVHVVKTSQHDDSETPKKKMAESSNQVTRTRKQTLNLSSATVPPTVKKQHRTSSSSDGQNMTRAQWQAWTTLTNNKLECDKLEQEYQMLKRKRIHHNDACSHQRFAAMPDSEA
jgi:hypothetical protein